MALASTVSQAVERLRRGDLTLMYITLTGKKYTDAGLCELADSLLARPHVVRFVFIAENQLTDETGVKLARCLAASSTIESMDLSGTCIGEATYLALAAALRVNSSLQVFFLSDNQAVDQDRIDAAFVEALRLNHNRPAESVWYLYSYANEFERLKHAAEQLGHPSLQMLLALLV